MTASRRRSGKGRNRQAQAPAVAPETVFWTAAAPLPPVAPITIAENPSAMLRSLGTPPLTGQGDAQEKIVLVAARAAGVATALAAAADILDYGTDPV